MIIKSHIRGGYRAAADYLKDIGQNEKTRLVEISDPDAKNLDEAFQSMWAVASNSRVKKALHHISINPFKDERLTDEQVMKIVWRCEEKYGYAHGDHQRVIVEHIKNGRQHFHIIWNRVSLTTNKAVWPGHHWKKSKQAAREMERELGLKRPIPRRGRHASGQLFKHHKHGLSLFVPMSHMIGMNWILAPQKTASPPDAKPQANVINPLPHKKGWPEAAVIDWELWGHKNPRRFFAIWTELTPPGWKFEIGR